MRGLHVGVGPIRFIALAMSGDRSIRRIEDVGSDANQFAMAKALASGDPRLMQKAGLEAEIARLDRQRAAHFDDQQAVRHRINHARSDIRAASRALEHLAIDLQRRQPTQGDSFAMVLDDKRRTERKAAGAFIIGKVRLAMMEKQASEQALGSFAGFDLAMEVKTFGREHVTGAVRLELTGRDVEIEILDDVGPLGVIARLENALGGLEREDVEQRRALADAEQRLPGYEARLGGAFEFAAELEGKLAELAELEIALATTQAANDEEQGGEEERIAV